MHLATWPLAPFERQRTLISSKVTAPPYFVVLILCLLVETRSDSPAECRSVPQRNHWVNRQVVSEGPLYPLICNCFEVAEGFWRNFHFRHIPQNATFPKFWRECSIFVAFLEIFEMIDAMIGGSRAMIVNRSSCYEPELTHQKQVDLDNLQF